MSIRYMDPVGGSDAADGTSFANRFASFASGATSGRVTAGDTVRLIASPEPTSLGDVTWTDGSNALALAAAKTLTIDNCETAWTAVTNVTCNVTSSDKYEGTNAATFAVGSSFTTGKAAYKAVTLDLSAYEQVSLWFKSTVSLAAGVAELHLCSDATGDTAVHTVKLPETTTEASGTLWQVVLKDFGTTLNASIASVSLYFNSDPGTPTITLDNIIACKASDAADCLTHISLVSKNTVGEPEWYAVQAINGTAVTLGIQSSVSIPTRGYNGTTETVATSVRQPLYNVDAIINSALGISGTQAAPITVSGGWNRTDMSTQTGETWLSLGWHYRSAVNGQAISIGSRKHLRFDTIGVSGCASCAEGDGAEDVEMDLIGIAGCLATVNFINSANIKVDGGNVMHNKTPFPNGTNINAPGHHYLAERVAGALDDGCSCYSTSLYPIVLDIGKIDNSRYAAVGDGANCIYRGTTMADNTNGVVSMNGIIGGPCALVDCVVPAEPTQGTSGYESQVRFHNYNQTAGDHRVISDYWKAVTDATVRHTASGVSWKITMTTADKKRFFPLAKFAVNASALVTCKAWVRRDNTGLDIGIVVKGGQIAGVSSDVTDTISVGADTWEELTLTFTPTAAGVVELLGHAVSSGTTYSGWWDDLSLTQA